MQLELTAWGIFLVRTLKRLTIPLGSSKSYLELGNPLLEEKLGNFSNLSVFSRFFFFLALFPCHQDQRAQGMVPFIYGYNKYPLHFGFAQDSP